MPSRMEAGTNNSPLRGGAHRRTPAIVRNSNRWDRSEKRDRSLGPQCYPELGGASDQPLESRELKASIGWGKLWSAPTRKANRSTDRSESELQLSLETSTLKRIGVWGRSPAGPRSPFSPRGFRCHRFTYTERESSVPQSSAGPTAWPSWISACWRAAMSSMASAMRSTVLVVTSRPARSFRCRCPRIEGASWPTRACMRRTPGEDPDGRCPVRHRRGIVRDGSVRTGITDARR